MTDFESFFLLRNFFRQAKRLFLKRSRAGASIREGIFSKVFANVNQKSSNFWKKFICHLFFHFSKKSEITSEIRKNSQKKLLKKVRKNNHFGI